jgi:predicted DNA binding CopG/RHH family protein
VFANILTIIQGVKMPNVMQQLFVMNIESLLKEYAAYRAFNKSNCVINMRIPEEILTRIKKLADEQHVPYQSLISSVLFSLANIDESKK